MAGIWNVRNRRLAAHQTCMLIVAAVTSGALLFRIFLAVWAGYGNHHSFNNFYALNAWIAWTLPLIGMGIFCAIEEKSQVKCLLEMEIG